MFINCKICSKLYQSIDEIVVTMCGHLFHKSCLNNWIINYNNCAQCQIPCSIDNILKIEFNEISEIEKMNFNDNLELIGTEKLQLNQKNNYTKSDQAATKLLQNEIKHLKSVIDTMYTAKIKTSEELNHLQNQLNLAIKKYEICDQELVHAKAKTIKSQSKYEFLIEKTKANQNLEILRHDIELLNLKENYEKKLHRAQQEINELNFLNLALAKETFADPRNEFETEITGL